MVWICLPPTAISRGPINRKREFRVQTHSDSIECHGELVAALLVMALRCVAVDDAMCCL